MGLKDILQAFVGGSYIVPAFYIGAIAALLGAIQAIAVSFFSRGAIRYISFAVLCLNACAILWSSGDYYSATSMAEAVRTLRWSNDWACPIFVSLYWFIALYTRQRTIFPWILLPVCISCILLISNNIEPGTMRFSVIDSIQTLRLPWGETIHYLTGPFSPWNVLIRISGAVMVGWAIWRTVILYRTGYQRDAWFIAVYLCAQYLATQFGFLSDLGYIHAIYLYGFVVLMLTVFLSVSMHMDLRDGDESFRSILKTTLDGFLRLDRKGKLIDANQTYCQLSGYTRDELLKMHLSELRALEDAGTVAMHIQQVIKTGRDQFESIHRRKDGTPWHVEVSTTYCKISGGQFFAFIRDITKRKQAEEQILTLANFDPLTKLPNRLQLMNRLNHALQASKRTQEFGAVIILDLDHFKLINDTQGREIGDCLLIAAADRISSSVTPAETVFRLGDDEFVVMAEGFGTDETPAAGHAEKIAEIIREALNQPYEIAGNGQTYRSTPSIGVTLFQGQEQSVDVLLKQADVALYQAKTAGRNTIRFFNPAMQAAIDSRSAMEAALHTGFKKNEFRLIYQLQFDQQGQPTGVEGLLRWLPAKHAPVSPAQFIPLAEEIGLIIPLGQWVIQTACAQLKAWESNPEACKLHIAVNVSAHQLRQVDFFEQVRHCLEQSGANPAHLKLELTESVMVHDVEGVISRMLQIKSLGVKFSLDDFGTGFSSLSYLKRLPLDQVKIDQSFVRDITTDPSDAAIVRAIIAMAHSLAIEVIAEGVESKSQLEFLQESGCRNFQGYLFARPMPIGDLDQLLANSRSLATLWPAAANASSSA